MDLEKIDKNTSIIEYSKTDYNSRKFNIGYIGIIFALISKDDIKKMQL